MSRLRDTTQPLFSHRSSSSHFSASYSRQSATPLASPILVSIALQSAHFRSRLRDEAEHLNANLVFSATQSISRLSMARRHHTPLPPERLTSRLRIATRQSNSHLAFSSVSSFFLMSLHTSSSPHHISVHPAPRLPDTSPQCTALLGVTSIYISSFRFASRLRFFTSQAQHCVPNLVVTT